MSQVFCKMGMASQLELDAVRQLNSTLQAYVGMAKKNSDDDEPSFDEAMDEIYKVIHEDDKFLWLKLAQRRWSRRLVAYLEQRSGDDDKPSEPKRSPYWRRHFVAIFGLLFKLLKTASVAKPALFAVSLAGWTIISSWQFAVVIIAVIMFHEYGHVRAMKKFSIPTKGMYLIPFVGGVAIGNKPKTQWQDVYISMMGPMYGLLMTIVFYLMYLVSGSDFLGLVAAVSGLVNIFNLLPIYPLDGGRVLKSIAVSMNKLGGLLFLLAFSLAGFFLSIEIGLHFFSVIIVLGAVDTFANLGDSSRENLLPLTPYGMIFSLIWHLSAISAFLLVIYGIAQSGVLGSEFVTKILES